MRKHPDSDARQDAPARRVQFAGAINFRDLGGYRTADGRQVAWRRLYRSDSLADLTDADLAVLEGLRLHSICDFRLDSERKHKPNRLPDQHGMKLHSIPFAPQGTLDMWRALNQNQLDAAEVEERMLQHYRAFALEHTREYRQMFDLLLADDALPLLIHCASGKDRTGFGAALILTALGVPRETVVDDYRLSDKYRRDLPHILRPDLDPAVRAALLQAHPSYLAAAFDTIEATWGTEDEFLRKAIGLSDRERERLRELLLEKT